MSDLCVYKKLEDISWDELGDDNHHIVPHIGTKKKGYSITSDFNKKPKYDLTHSDNTLNYNNAANNGAQMNGEITFTTVAVRENGPMLEKGPCRYQTKEPFSSSRDDNRTSNRCISSNMNSICGDSCVDDVDNTLFYQMNNANQNDVGLMENSLQDKESNDLLYYGWPEIENFDEVDRMFRSCDSTFGLNIDNGDELGWFSLSHEIEGSDDVLKSNFDFSGGDEKDAVNNATQHQNVYGLNDTDMLINENDCKFTLVDSKGSSLTGTDNHADNGLQVQSCVSQSKQQKPSQEKRKEPSPNIGGSSFRSDNLVQVKESNKSSNFPNSWNNDFRSTSLSNKSNEMQQCGLDIPFQNPNFSENEKKDREKRKSNKKCEPQSGISCVENDFEGIGEVNGSDIGIIGKKIDTSDIQGSSCVSSVVDEVSVEASSFRQLQQVMEQLDVRTKLCIRDSLYRLARSAEQRHKCVGKTNGGRSNKDENAPLISDETDKCTTFMDIETETNPIDRSIAHLLFHRPSDPSAIAARDDIPSKSHHMVQAPHKEETTPATNEASEE